MKFRGPKAPINILDGPAFGGWVRAAIAFAFHGKLPQGCFAVESNLLNVIWSASDTQNVNVDNQHGMTFRTVTCINATAVPVIVKATLAASKNNGHQATGSATLLCK